MNPRQFVMLRPLTVGLLAVALVATACSSDGSDAAVDPTPTGSVSGQTPSGASETLSSGAQRGGDFMTVGFTGDDGSPGVNVALRQGEGSAVDGSPPEAPVQGEPLSESDVAATFERLPELQTEPGDQVDFNRPVETRPPPVVGDTIIDSFPPAVEAPPPPEVFAGPLEVLRYQPEGDVAIAPSISVTFDQPMVPLGTLAQLDAEQVPVVMTPTVPGRWQWIGTKTLRFEADPGLTSDQLPRATEYTVEIPAGTQSATGNELEEPVRFTFATPPAEVVSAVPSSSSGSRLGVSLEPVFVVRFNQAIDADEIFGITSLLVAGVDTPIRPATAEEIEAEHGSYLQQGPAWDGRWIAFRPVDPLPKATTLEVRIGPDIPSAEGPRLNPSVESFTNFTYMPLEVTNQSCRSASDCPPFSSLWIEFNNELDLEAFDSSAISIDPPLENAFIEAYSNGINIRGNTQGSTTYTVTLPEALRDVHAQTLGAAVRLTFKIDKARPALLEFPRPFITLDPLSGDQSISVATINHEKLNVRLFEASTNDWPAVERFMYDDAAPLPNWTEISRRTVDVTGDQDMLTETRIALDELIADGHNQIIMLVESTGALAELSQNNEDYWANRRRVVWIQSTNLGVDAFTDGNELVVWVTDLRDGSAVGNVSVSSSTGEPSATTNENGIARLPLAKASLDHIVASVDGDNAVLLGNWGQNLNRDSVRWFVLDDRQMYRPGETAHIKGFVRELTLATDAQIQLLDSTATISWTASDWFGNEFATGSASVSPLGGFDFSLDVPLDVNLGTAQIQLALSTSTSGTLNDTTNWHSINIQEFRRPEFEVTARSETEGPFLVETSATVAVAAAYFAGGGLPNAPVAWDVTTTNTSYSPPNWSEWTFGRWIPWWYGDQFGSESRTSSLGGTTDSAGEHFLDLDFTAGDSASPVTVTASATVTDVNRQAWSANTSLLVHPAQLYVGLKSDSMFVRRGEPLVVDVVAVDLDGALAPNVAVSVIAERLEWGIEDGDWQQIVRESQSCDLPSAGTAAGESCTFTTTEGGQYRITATIRDDSGRVNTSVITRWVSGGNAPATRGVEHQAATLIPNAQTYAPGDVAEVLVESPFTPATGNLTIVRGTIRSTEPFSIVDGSTILEIPIADSDIPNLDVRVELVGATERTADDGTQLSDVSLRPAFASGDLSLSIAPTSRELTITAAPATDPLPPGSDTSVDVSVRDVNGQPVADAEVAVIVVDEAVLALSGYQLGNPMDAFYSPIGGNVWAVYGRDSIILSNPALLLDQAANAMQRSAAAGEGGEMMADDSAMFEASAPSAASAGGTTGAAITVRANFDALATFSPTVMTDTAGTATVSYTLPDNLTRYRVMVVGAAGDDMFGATESNLTARLPLMVRPSAPRFLNFGDEFELPVVVQNQTDGDLEVDVVLAATNLELTDGAGQRVLVPANDRVEVRFAARAVEAGTARFQVAAVSGELADAATVDLPVYTPSTTEAFATYGVLDDGVIAQPVLAPENVFPQFGGLEITTSSTAVQALTDAVIYFHDYRYDSSDGLAARILAVNALDDVLGAFAADGLPSPDVLRSGVQNDISSLVALQNFDGGFPWWSRGRESVPYASVHAAHALVEADKGGYAVPQGALQQAQSYLQNIEFSFPAGYTQLARDTVTSYALHVRNLTGDRDSALAQTIWQRSGDGLSLDAAAWLWPVLSDDVESSDAIERLFLNRATETAGAATFTTDYGEEAYLLLASDRRTDGVILDALITQRPESDLIPKIVKGLLAGQTRGRWNNAQENAFILLALNHYFLTFESVTPDFVARVWLGDTYVAEQEYLGRSTDSHETLVPMSELLGDSASDVVMAKEGDGRLYYRLGMSYAPEDLMLDPLDRGFVVQRSYVGVDDPSDVTRDDDGVWHIRAGAEVRVNLTMVNDSRRTHVALLDPLPAGLEPLNPALAVTELPPLEGESQFGDAFGEDSGSWWWWQWYQHENLRDDRAEAFSDYLEAGTWDYSYIARATTPGRFVTPPAKAEEIFAPEVFGRGASDIVVVEER